MTKEAGVRCISLKDMHLPMKSTPEQRKEAHQKIEAAGLVLMGGGVITSRTTRTTSAPRSSMPRTRECRPSSKPKPDGLDLVEELLQAIQHPHCHPWPRAGDRDPRPWSLKLVKARDGAWESAWTSGTRCVFGQDPVEVIHKCSERLYDFHIKEVTRPTPKESPSRLAEA